jgi:hypothetical protein
MIGDLEELAEYASPRGEGNEGLLVAVTLEFSPMSLLMENRAVRF